MKQKLSTNILLSLFVVILIFLIGEIGLRLYIDNKYSEENFKNLAFGDRTNLFRKEIAKKRFRGYTYPNKKQENVTRIAIVGDSFTYSYGINNLNDTYPKILEQKLNKNSNEKYEVMNFGWRGLNIVDIYWVLKYEVIKYNPDYIIYGYYPNDAEFLISNINFNYCHLFSKSKRYLLTFLDEKIDNVYIRIFGAYLWKKDFYYSRINSNNYYSNLCFKNILDKIHKETNSENIEFILFMIPHHHGSNDEDERINSLLSKTVNDLNISSIDSFYKMFWKSTNKDEKYWNDQDHYNEKAHIIFSDILYNYTKNEN